MGIQDEVSKLVGSSSAKHKRLIEYVVRQVRNDRNLRDVLEDPYVTNRLNALERRALLEEPEVVAAVNEDVLQGMRAHLETVLGN
ncbi:MAG TPA: hypothetical protein VNT51_01770 [Miltoncostaeaceae bacterium]|nr:hypothetical protein [Miltoncostaeaceae bacterium]